MGLDPEEALDEAIRADNACLEGSRPPGSHPRHPPLPRQQPQPVVRLRWLRPIAEKLFNQLDVDLFLLEYESERVRHLRAAAVRAQANKAVVLGLVSSKLPELESADELTRRIEEASRYVPLDHLASVRSAASPRRWKATC